MAIAADFAQKMWARSPPDFREDIAVKYGAPVNSNEPPITPIRPLSPLCFIWLSLGRIL